MSSPFEKLLGVTPELLILEEILCPPCDHEFSINDISYIFTRISREKIRKVFKKFRKWGIIIPCIETIKLSGIAPYKLNLESPYVKAIIAFNNALIEDAIGEEGLYEIHEYLEECKNEHCQIEGLQGVYDRFDEIDRKLYPVNLKTHNTSRGDRIDNWYNNAISQSNVQSNSQKPLKLKVDRTGCVYDESTGTVVDVE
jgi:hypothetical protein